MRIVMGRVVEEKSLCHFTKPQRGHGRDEKKKGKIYSIFSDYICVWFPSSKHFVLLVLQLNLYNGSPRLLFPCSLQSFLSLSFYKIKHEKRMKRRKWPTLEWWRGKKALYCTFFVYFWVIDLVYLLIFHEMFLLIFSFLSVPHDKYIPKFRGAFTPCSPPPNSSWEL